MRLQVAAAAGDGVDLVDEDDRWAVLPGALAPLADVPLRLADPFAGHVGAGDRVEGRSRLRGQDLGDRRLSRSRRAREEKSGRWLDADPPRRLRIFDHALELLQLSLDRSGQDQRFPRPVLHGRSILATVALDGSE